MERKCKDDWTTIVKSANGDKPTDQPKDGQKDSKKSYTSNKYKAKNYFKVRSIGNAWEIIKESQKERKRMRQHPDKRISDIF